MSSIHQRVKRFGVALQRINADPPGLSWTYSIGLAARNDHAELLVLGGTPRQAARLLDAVREQIDEGVRLEPGGEVMVEGTPIGIGEVHPHHVANGVVASWTSYYAWLGRGSPPLEVLQLVLPDAVRCREHSVSVPLLSDPLASWEAGIATAPDHLDRAELRRRQRADAKRQAIEQRYFN